MSWKRRSLLLSLGAGFALAGCTEESSTGESDQTSDSDGDGMPDRSDYAPRDPSVQSENDVSGDSATSSGDSTTSSGDSAGSDAEGNGGTAGDVSYPSHSGSHTIDARDNYWAWEFTVSERFVLSYTVQNLRDENYDFDVLLYDPASFREYRAIATEREEGIRPQYLDGSAPGTESGARVTVELAADTYYLVVDNTDLSDAGDWDTEDTRRVSVRAETMVP